MRVRVACPIPAALLCALAALPGAARAEDPAPDFAREVRPILVQRCVPCHGPSESNAGLRLDRRDLAELGGDSGGAVLARTGPENELLRRIESHDPDVRMPPDELLPPAELEVLRRWVAAGTPWPEEGGAAAVSSGAAASGATAALVPAEEEPLEAPWAPAALQRRFLGTWWLGGGLVAILSLFVLAERARARARSATPTAATPALARLPRATWPVGLLLLALVGGEVDHHARHDLERARRRASEARTRELALSQGQVYGAPYGDPPRPPRSLHLQPALARRYWRGNCERSPALWNHGHYATALVDLTLVDGEDRPLRHGDPWPAAGAALRLEVQRAPHATKRLFTRGLMRRVFLSTSPLAAARGRPGSVPLEELEEHERWRARWPLPRPRGRHVEHLVYVVFDRPHLGAVVELHLGDDGRIAPETTVWLGLLYWNPRVALPQPGKVPQHEFLDDRPIPAIEDESQVPDDPALLGTGEYTEEGRD